MLPASAASKGSRGGEWRLWFPKRVKGDSRGGQGSSLQSFGGADGVRQSFALCPSFTCVRSS